MFSLFQDIRFGLRMLWKHRLASLVCVIALGLGMGATAAIFSPWSQPPSACPTAESP